MINEKRLQMLLKTKKYENMSLDELIDEYIALMLAAHKENIEELLSSLLILIQRYDNKLTRKTLEEMSVAIAISSKIIPKNPAIIPLFYEKALTDGTKMVFKLGVEDVRGIQALNDRLLWVNDNYNERVADKLKEIFEDSKRGKYTTLELLDKLREEIPEYSNLEAHRLQAAADLTLRQTKNMGVASRAIGLGDKYLQVVAKMDDRTTNICRSMHLRLIPIEHIKKQYDNIVNAKSVEEIKAATNMGLSQKGLFTPDIPANIGIPPYHFGCRTFLRQVDSTYIKDREKDQFGRLYKIRDKDVYNKIKNKDDHLKASREKSVENLMRATMGNIKLEGVHNNEKDKRVILADNGFLAFIDANGNIETIFTTDRKYETPMEYFEKVTNQTYYDSLKKSNIRKVIKWILEHLK